MIDRASGRNVLRVPTFDEPGYPLAGGYSEFAPALGDGWSASNVRIFSGTVDKMVDGTMSARISAPLGANIWGHKSKVENTRTFTLAPGAHALSIVSAVKNISGGTLEFAWQSRPEFAVSATAQARMELLDRRGNRQAVPLPEAKAKAVALPEATTAIRLIDQATGLVVTNSYDPQQPGRLTVKTAATGDHVVLNYATRPIEIPADDEVIVLKHQIALIHEERNGPD